MPQSEMARYAWAVYGSGRKYNQVVSRANGMKAIVNNIYSIGDYFFIDYSLQNSTKIAYDIAEVTSYCARCRSPMSVRVPISSPSR